MTPLVGMTNSHNSNCQPLQGKDRTVPAKISLASSSDFLTHTQSRHPFLYRLFIERQSYLHLHNTFAELMHPLDFIRGGRNTREVLQSNFNFFTYIHQVTSGSLKKDTLNTVWNMMLSLTERSSPDLFNKYKDIQRHVC